MFFWDLFYLELLIVGVVFFLLYIILFFSFFSLRSVQFGLCSIRIIFFLSFFLLLLFFFYQYIPWQTLTNHRIAGNREKIIVFLVFYFHLLTNIHLVHRDFYHFFSIDLFVIIRLIADETFFPSKFAFSLM